MSGYVGVDLDGTLAEYHGWQGPTDIGPPVPAMVERVQKLLAGKTPVVIFTSRVADDPDDRARVAIEAWCLAHLGQVLPITCVKSPEMYQLWDDRVVLVERNTGRVLSHADMRQSEKLLDEVLRAAYPAHGPRMQLCACSICRDIDRILSATRSGPAVEVPA